MSSTSRPRFSHPLIVERAIDETRRLKVTYIGAGMSGVIAGILLPRYVPDIELTIYEKNDDVGGTWFENRYPGCACDIPAHSYQLTFESNPSWSKFYVPAHEIQQYWHRVAKKYGVMPLIRFRHKCLEADWDNELSQWRIRIEVLDSGHVLEEISDVLIVGLGPLNNWKWPDIKGLHDFKGKIMHSAAWESGYDLKDDSVAVIGTGSSAIQIVPTIQSTVKQLDHYARNPTWISTSFGHELVRERNEGADGNFSYTAEELSRWNSDPDAYMKYRRRVEAATQRGYITTHRGTPELKAAREFFESDMQARLSSSSSSPSKAHKLSEHMIPHFSPFCRRLTPGPGYLEALTAPNVTVIPTSISHITTDSIVTTDGISRPVNTIICATGFDTSFRHRQPLIRGRTGLSLTEYYAATSTSSFSSSSNGPSNLQRPSSYLGIGTDTFPNFFQAGSGPNSGGAIGNYVADLERIHSYIGQLLARLAQSDVRTLEPRPAAVRAFTDHCDAFFERTTFSEPCSSWYKSAWTEGGDRAVGRVSALWPGSALHHMAALRRVRWEDWVVGTVPPAAAAASWLGNGFTTAELRDDLDEMVNYLDGVGGDWDVLGLRSGFVHEDLKGGTGVNVEINGSGGGHDAAAAAAAINGVD